MHSPFHSRRRLPHQRRRSSGTAVWLLLMVMLLTPLGGQLATARQADQALAQDGDDTTSEEGIATEVPPDDQGAATEVPPTDPLPTEDPASDSQPTEDPALLATEIPTEAPAQTLTITVYRCDHPEFDTGFSENLQQVLTTCTGGGSGTFTVSTGTGETTQSGSSLSFSIVGDLFLQELVPAGYDDPIANCFLNDANGVLADQIGPGEAGSGFWKVGGLRGGDVHCDWYQVDRGLGTVYVVNMACPSTAGLFPAPSLTELIALCTEPAGQRQFFVQHGGLERMGVTGGEFNDVLFEAIKAGPIAIRLDDPTGFDSARVFCQVTTLEGAEIAPFAEVGVSGFSTSGLNLVHGQRLHCSWFNILQGPGLENPTGNEPPLATQPPAGAPADLTMQVHSCPLGYDPASAAADPTTDCPLGPDGVTFTLTDQDPATIDLQATTGQSGLGAATFAGIAAGDYTVSEAIPAGVATIFVLGCGGGGGVDPVPVFIDGTLQMGIPQGVLLTCHWFHIPGATLADTDRADSSPIAATPASIAALTGTSSITIHAYECPAGFDVTTIDSNPSNACTTPDSGASFNLDNDFSDQGAWGVDTDQTGVGTVSNLPAGTFTIEASVRNGTTAVFAWDCYDASGASNRTDPLSMTNVAQVEVVDGAQIRCDWFFVVGGTARVVINSHACGILVPAYTLTREQLGQQCTEDPGTIQYTVVSDVFQETQPASQNPLLLASFANVPSGYIAAVEDLPDGWATPIVWCQVFTENGDPVGPELQMNVFLDRQVMFMAEPGQVVSCDWYNVIQGFVDVHVTKYACPATIDPFTADLTELVLGCTDDPGSVNVTVEDGRLYFETVPATGGQPASFLSIPSGDIRVSEELPDGFGLPVVWCRIDFEDGSNVVPAQAMAVANGPSITQNLSAGQSLWCEWFNVQGGLGMVSIWKEACPAGFDAQSATLGELEAACNDAIPDVPFSLQAGTFSDTATSTNLFRYADFLAVPTGPLTVTESVPPDYGEPVVWCRVQEPALPVTTPVRMTVADGTTIAWDLGPNQWLICDWFNAIDTGSTVSVTKYDCPEGTGYEEDDAWYQANCTATMADVPFTLTHSEGQAMGTTDASGEVQWADVPLGPFSLQEIIPTGYGDPVVICGMSAFSNGAIYDGFPLRVEAEGGYVASTLEIPNTSYFCFWYNIPAGPGEVTIYKFTCPAGYDVHAGNADPLTECSAGTNGVTYTATGPNGYTSQTATGDSIDAAVVFGGLEPGAYTFTETLPDGTTSAFVWDCYGQRMGELRPTPLTTGDTLNLAVGAGEDIACYWYNVPADPSGTLTVIKFECSTPTFVSEVDCEIYEGGQGFDLAQWDGDTWQVIATGTTDAWGRYAWTELDTGQYWVAEQEREWCQMTSEQLSADGNWLDVTVGQETMVKVYNCTGEPGKPGKTPAKYPNTGVPITIPRRVATDGVKKHHTQCARLKMEGVSPNRPVTC